MATDPIDGLDVRILRTCKQLYAEGKEILYSKTAGCRVGEPYISKCALASGCDKEAYVLHDKHQLDLSQFPDSVVKYMTKMRITLFAHHGRGYDRKSREAAVKWTRKAGRLVEAGP